MGKGGEGEVMGTASRIPEVFGDGVFVPLLSTFSPYKEKEEG